MDEQAIVDQLKVNIPKPEVAPAIVEATKLAANEAIAKPTELHNDLAALKLLDYFAVPRELRNDRKTLDQLSFIHEWASGKPMQIAVSNKGVATDSYISVLGYSFNWQY